MADVEGHEMEFPVKPCLD